MLAGFLITTVAGGVLSLLGRVALSQISARYESRNSEFAGRWYAVTPPVGAETERRDIIRVRQSGPVLHVTAKRYIPDEERGRVWKMTGYCHGNVLVATFYTTVPRSNPSSYGVLVLHRDPAVRVSNVWRGHYSRPDMCNLDAIVDGSVPKFPIVWQQISPDKQNYAEIASTLGASQLTAPASTP